MSIIASASCFMLSSRLQMKMSSDSLQKQISKAIGIAAMGIALAGPVLGTTDSPYCYLLVYHT